MTSRLSAAPSSMSEQETLVHGPALALGAGVGIIVMAVVVESFLLVLVLLLGAALGASVAGALALGWDLARGRREPSGDRPLPGIAPEGGPAAQRSEAGGPSPEPARPPR